MCDVDAIYELEELNVLNKVHHTAIIYRNVKLGKGNVIGPYAVIGSNGEIRNTKEFLGTVEIGDNNVISEHVTIQKPAKQGEKTVIGNSNMLMAHSHIGHDVKIGNNVEICTSVVIGGHSIISDDVRIKLKAVVKNRITVGKGAIIGCGAAVIRDVLENQVVVGVPAKFLKMTYDKK